MSLGWRVVLVQDDEPSEIYVSYQPIDLSHGQRPADAMVDALKDQAERYGRFLLRDGDAIDECFVDEVEKQVREWILLHPELVTTTTEHVGKWMNRPRSS